MKHRFTVFFLSQVALCLLLLSIWPRMELDDSYIFLTYARNLATTGKFFFNPGVLSYGFSSPAYVIVLAAVSRLTGMAVGLALSNLLGVLFCALSSCAVWMLWETVGELPEGRQMPLAVILLSGPWFFTVWFLFGMESGLAVTGMLGFLLWLAKLRVGAPRFPWLLVGLVSTSLLATTRLESSIFITCGVLLALLSKSFRSRSRGGAAVVDLLLVGIVAGGVEAAWLLYAHHTFGTYMPWSSNARMLYYIPGRFGVTSGAEYAAMGFGARTWVALQAASYILLHGSMKILLLTLPLAASVYYLRSLRGNEAWKWMLRLAALSLVLQIVCFAYLFPLAQNRHFAPYIAGLWVLVAPGVLRTVQGFATPLRVAVFAAAVVLWVGGALQYRSGGSGLAPLYDIVASGLLKPGDKVAAEPIGILSFEAPVQIVDLGGLTDRDSWPLLRSGQHSDEHSVLNWDLGKGATKVVIVSQWCPPDGRVFGRYCVIDAGVARRLASAPPPWDISPEQRR